MDFFVRRDPLLPEGYHEPAGRCSAGRLKLEEWRSGTHRVIVDFVSSFISDEAEKKQMLALVFGAKKKEGDRSE